MAERDLNTSLSMTSGGGSTILSGGSGVSLSPNRKVKITTTRRVLGKEKKGRSNHRNKKGYRWRPPRKSKAPAIDPGQLMELLDKTRTRIKATEGITGQSLTEEQLESLIRDVLDAPGAGGDSSIDSIGTVNTTEKATTQVVVTLMTLLLQKDEDSSKGTQKIQSRATEQPRSLLPGFTSAGGYSTSQSETSSTGTEGQINYSLFAYKKQSHNQNVTQEESQQEDELEAIGVEHTIEELHTVLEAMKKNAQNNDLGPYAYQDDETTLSVASTATFEEGPTALEAAFDEIFGMLGFSNPLADDDSILYPLEEEDNYSDDDDDDPSQYSSQGVDKDEQYVGVDEQYIDHGEQYVDKDVMSSSFLSGLFARETDVPTRLEISDEDVNVSALNTTAESAQDIMIASDNRAFPQPLLPPTPQSSLTLEAAESTDITDISANLEQAQENFKGTNNKGKDRFPFLSIFSSNNEDDSDIQALPTDSATPQTASTPSRTATEAADANLISSVVCGVTANLDQVQAGDATKSNKGFSFLSIFASNEDDGSYGSSQYSSNDEYTAQGTISSNADEVSLASVSTAPYDEEGDGNVEIVDVDDAAEKENDDELIGLDVAKDEVAIGHSREADISSPENIREGLCRPSLTKQNNMEGCIVHPFIRRAFSADDREVKANQNETSSLILPQRSPNDSAEEGWDNQELTIADLVVSSNNISALLAEKEQKSRRRSHSVGEESWDNQELTIADLVVSHGNVTTRSAKKVQKSHRRSHSLPKPSLLSRYLSPLRKHDGPSETKATEKATKTAKKRLIAGNGSGVVKSLRNKARESRFSKPRKADANYQEKRLKEIWSQTSLNHASVGSRPPLRPQSNPPSKTNAQQEPDLLDAGISLVCGSAEQPMHTNFCDSGTGDGNPTMNAFCVVGTESSEPDQVRTTSPVGDSIPYLADAWEFMTSFDLKNTDFPINSENVDEKRGMPSVGLEVALKELSQDVSSEEARSESEAAHQTGEVMATRVNSRFQRWRTRQQQQLKSEGIVAAGTTARQRRRDMRRAASNTHRLALNRSEALIKENSCTSTKGSSETDSCVLSDQLYSKYLGENCNDRQHSGKASEYVLDSDSLSSSDGGKVKIVVASGRSAAVDTPELESFPPERLERSYSRSLFLAADLEVSSVGSVKDPIREDAMHTLLSQPAKSLQTVVDQFESTVESIVNTNCNGTEPRHSSPPRRGTSAVSDLSDTPHLAHAQMQVQAYRPRSTPAPLRGKQWRFYNPDQRTNNNPEYLPKKYNEYTSVRRSTKTSPTSVASPIGMVTFTGEKFGGNHGEFDADTSFPPF